MPRLGNANRPFQRKLLLEGQSIYGVYPALNEENRKRFDQFKEERK